MHFGWELVARYAYLDYYDPNTPLVSKGTTSGNRLGQSTFGLKWYLADRLRILLITTTLYRMSQLLVRARPVFSEHGSMCIGENAFLLNRDGRITCSSYVSDFFLLAQDFVFLELEGRHQADPTAGMDRQGVAFPPAE